MLPSFSRAYAVVVGNDKNHLEDKVDELKSEKGYSETEKKGSNKIPI